jgi:RHS repeat-associated protein
LPRPHGLAEGTQKVWKGGPGGKLSRKFPPWPPEAFFSSAPDYRLLKAEEEDRDKAFTFAHDEDGQRVAKHLNGQLVEAYQWLDFVRLAAFYDGHHQYEFAYRDGERTPLAMRRDDGAVAGLFYDQVGSLRVVADLDDNVIKEVLYDPFGGIIEDTNPDLRLPLGFAGGLHDRDLGFVRFGWRDYDVRTGRWTAPDPIGDKGGDPDWYGYCLDDPVSKTDPLGLLTNEYGEKIPDGRIITEYVPEWDMLFGGIGTSKNVKKHLRDQKKEYTDENDWKIKKELDNEANDYNVFKGIWDTVTTDTDHEIYDKRVNNAKNRVGK